MTSVDIEYLARAARGNIQGSLSITHNLSMGTPAPSDHLLHRMNAVLMAVVNSDFHPASLQNVGALYVTIAEVQPRMVDNTHDLALVNMARSFAVVMEDAIRHRGGHENNNNNNNINKPAPGPINNNNINNFNRDPVHQEIRQTRLLGFGPPSTPRAPRAPSAPAPARRAASSTSVPTTTKDSKPPTTTKFNKASDLGFSTIPVDVESKELVLIYDNLLCFAGTKGVLTTRHEFPIAIDGYVYSSVDHYYQTEKCKHLVPGKPCTALTASIRKDDEQYRQQVKDLEAAREKREAQNEKLKRMSPGFAALERENIKNREAKEKEKELKEGKATTEKIEWAPINHCLVARAFLRDNKIPLQKVEEWRRSSGVVAVYRAMTAKAQQCTELRKYLHGAVNKIILHAYAGDAIFGCGADAAAVRKWAEDTAEKRGVLQIPLAPLLTHKAIIMSPLIAQGRNLLGLIHMQLAELIAKAGGSSNFIPLPSGFSPCDDEKKEEPEAES